MEQKVWDSSEVSCLARCPWKHLLRYNDNAPQVLREYFDADIPHTARWLEPITRSPAPAFGQDVHTALAALQNGATLDQAVEIWNERTEDADSPKHSNARGEAILRAYHKEYGDEQLYPIERTEVQFELDLDGLGYCGRIDGIALKDSEAWVIEHKTSSSGVGRDFLERNFVGYQIPGYVLGCKERFGSCDGVILDGLHVSKAQKQTFNFARHPIYSCELNVDRWRQDVLRLIDTHAVKWPYHALTACKDWGKCTYWQLCHEAESNVEIWLSCVEANYRSEKWEPLKEVKK